MYRTLILVHIWLATRFSRLHACLVSCVLPHTRTNATYNRERFIRKKMSKQLLRHQSLKLCSKKVFLEAHLNACVTLRYVTHEVNRFILFQHRRTLFSPILLLLISYSCAFLFLKTFRSRLAARVQEARRLRRRSLGHFVHFWILGVRIQIW